jgi:hypothetical protein
MEQIHSEFQRSDRAAFLRRVSSSAKRAPREALSEADVQSMAGPSAMLLQQVDSPLDAGRGASSFTDAQLASYVREVAWGKLAADMAAIAMRQKGGGGTGPTCATRCETEYDQCMDEHSCTSSFLCICCIPCSLQYIGCMRKCIIGIKGGAGGPVIV